MSQREHCAEGLVPPSAVHPSTVSLGVEGMTVELARARR